MRQSAPRTMPSLSVQRSHSSQKHVWSVRTRLQLYGRLRDLALFGLAVDSKLRACDLVRLCVEDLAPHGYVVLQRQGTAVQLHQAL